MLVWVFAYCTQIAFVNLLWPGQSFAFFAYYSHKLDTVHLNFSGRLGGKKDCRNDVISLFTTADCYLLC